MENRFGHSTMHAQRVNASYACILRMQHYACVLTHVYEGSRHTITEATCNTS